MVTSQRRCVASVWLCQDYITKPTSRGGGTHRSSPRASNGRLDLWGSRSIRTNRFQIVWFDTDSLISSFLPPLAPSALPDFIATMEALTAVWGWHRANLLPRQLSPLTYTSFGTFPLQPCPNVLNSMITGGCHRLRSRIIAQASPLTSRLVTFAHRIEFTSVWDRSFALGCFPPRLTTTQFPSASSPVTGSKKFRFSLTGEYIVTVTLGTALCRGAGRCFDPRRRGRSDKAPQLVQPMEPRSDYWKNSPSFQLHPLTPASDRPNCLTSWCFGRVITRAIAVMQIKAQVKQRLSPSHYMGNSGFNPYRQIRS